MNQSPSSRVGLSDTLVFRDFDVIYLPKYANNAVRPQSLVVVIVQVLNSTMSTIELCGLTALFGDIWRQTNTEISGDLGILFWP